MKKVLLVLGCLLFSLSTNANEEVLVHQNSVQSRIDNIGTKILNSNRLDKRVVFVYDDKEKLNILKQNKALTKRQVIIFGEDYKSISNDDELAAYIARQIPVAIRSYDGVANGVLSSIKIKAAPKKFELVCDKMAVDYMVKAGYNPIGLITYINKTCPQARQDKISNKNLTSKRLAKIYERIYIEYPKFLTNNEYLHNEHYQNFLLTSQENRRLLKEKVDSSNWKKELDYE